MYGSMKTLLRKETQRYSNNTLSVDRIGTAASTKGILSNTGTSFRPNTQMSINFLSMTSSMNNAPFLRSTYLPDYEKKYKTLDFGVEGRKGIF